MQAGAPSTQNQELHRSEQGGVFLCCAPEEREFAESLAEALRLGRLKAFVGGSHAEGLGEQEPRIRSAIDAASSFVFVLSPASVASPRCREQLAHAVKGGKRLVPVIRRDVLAREVPRAISSIAPIVFREQEDPKAAMRALLLALGTDITVDVFICYARKDKSFVDRLYASFDRAGKRTWLDMKSIPSLSEWRSEIEAGIEAAGSFIFVLSPDSAASPECRKELEHALRLNKRLVPVLYRDVPDTVVPAPLARIQRVPVGDEGFESAFEGLLAALDTDLEYVRAHTRLLVRALEWEKQRDESLLLQGKDLEAAEAFLSAIVPPTGPQPVPLQAEYILTSRKAATKRLRLLLAAVGTGLLITVVLLLTAVYQYTQKEQQRRIAVSRLLAAQATERIPRRLDLALLLGVESFETAHTVEARSALLSALRYSPYLKTFLHGHNRRISQGVFSRDGKWFASASHDGSVVLWDHPAARAISPLLSGTKEFVEDVAFSADGQLLASASGDGAVRIWKTASREPLCDPLKGDAAPMQSVAFGPQGRLMVAGSFTGKLWLWDLEQCRPLGQAEHGATGPVYRVAFNPGGDMLASSHGDGSVLLWTLQQGELQLAESPRLISAGAGVLDMAFSADGRWLAMGAFDGSVRLWSAEQPDEPPVPLLERGDRILSVAFSPDGQQLAAGGVDGQVRLWRLPWRVEQPALAPGRQGWITSLAFSPDGKELVSGTADGVLAVWDMDAYRDAGEYRPLGRRLIGLKEQVNGFAFAPGSGTLAAGGLSGSVVLWDFLPAQQSPAARRCAGFEDANSLAFHPSRDEVAVAIGGMVQRLDARSCEPIGEPLRPLEGTESLQGIIYSSDGSQVLAGSNSGEIYVWDVASGKSRRVTPQPGITVVAVAFSLDGRLAALGANDGGIILVETGAEGRVYRSATAHEASVTALAFSPDGRILLSGGDDGMVRFWDASRGAPLGMPMRTHARRVFSVAFAGDGQLAASGNDDGTLMLWDVMSRQPIGLPFKGHDDRFVTALAFTPDGAGMVSGDEGGSVILWDVGATSWQARACRIANRPFRPEERALHLEGEPERDTCRRLKEGTTPGTPSPSSQ